MVLIHIIDGEEILWSEKFACIKCNYSLPDLEPRMFSFNAPFGACPECKGLGFKTAISQDLLVPDPDKSINGGAIATMSDDQNIFYTDVKTACNHYNIDMNSLQLDSIQNKKHILTPDNIESYFDIFEQKIQDYDLTPLINIIKDSKILEK